MNTTIINSMRATVFCTLAAVAFCVQDLPVVRNALPGVRVGQTYQLYGIASTDSPDRKGSIVLTKGLKVSKNIPLLLNHIPSQQLGRVEEFVKTPDGILYIRAMITVNRDNLKAVRALVNKDVSFLSIGFLPGNITADSADNVLITSGDLLEISATPTPANGECRIDTVVKADLGIISLVEGMFASDNANVKLTERD